MHGASHEVLGRLAVGGMAEIYVARTTHDDGRREIVVLKRILPHLSEDPEFVRMFRDEAYLAATLDHPNIVHVHDIGQDGEDYFFTMEYVHGENVRSIIKAAQKVEMDIPLEHVVQIAIGVCEGLHYAHEQVDDEGEHLRIVHRDVSPTNILVSFDGQVKIVDFGIAKAAAATHVTQAGMLKGKASYMSPEQCRAEPVDRRSDVFAIGILLFEMTTLTRLFRGDNELAVLHQILTGAVDAPSTRVDDYPADLEHIVMKALGPKPGDRYDTALAMRDDLERFARVRGLELSNEGLGEYLRDLCGDRPYPWEDDEDELDEDEIDELGGLDAADESGSSTSLGHFEDDEDTQVNRRTPDVRTLIPTQQPSGLDEHTGPTNRRAAPGGARGAPRPTPRPAGGRLRLPNKGMPRRRPSSTDVTVDLDDQDEPDSSRGELTTPMSKPAARSARHGLAAPRQGNPPPSDAPTMPQGAGSGPVARPFGSPQQPFAQSGRTLRGPGGGLGGPMPARSGRTMPGGNAQSPLAGNREGAAGPLPGGGADRTMPAGAGSRPRAPTGHTRPGRRPSEPAVVPFASPSQAPAQADRTMAMTAEQARAMAQAGASASPPLPSTDPWSGAGVGRTEVASPQHAMPQPAQIDEGARTIAMPRFDRSMLANPNQELPKGPMGWTQQGTPSTNAEDSGLTSTQRSPITPMTSTQRSPSFVYPEALPGEAHPIDGRVDGRVDGQGAELRRPEMRSPSPRPGGTPRSLWVPVLIVLIVGLAGTAAWLWWRSVNAAEPAAAAEPSSPPDRS